MLTVVKRSSDELRDMLATEAGFISAFCQHEGEPITLEPYQVAFLNNRSRFRWITKSRQVGYSFLIALEALARCHLQDNHTAAVVSYNRSEASEKTLLARQIYEQLPLAFQKKLVTDSKTELAFEAGGAKGGISRIISVPSKAPRGLRGNVYLDELAHSPNDREVYTGSTALIVRSGGQLTGCSTPLGRRGIFWEIATEETRKFPQYRRQIVPWWLCRFFCKDTKQAALIAPHLPTEEAVELFGKQTIIEQFQSLALEDFEQEFCARFVDHTYSFYSLDLIHASTADDLVLADDATDVPLPKGRIVAGFDVGRTRDRSELAVFEEHEGRFTCRMLRTYTETPFAEQEHDLRRMLEILPVARLSIDNSGIGMNLAENLARDYPQVVRENFTNEAKERWATDFKISLQRRQVELPRDRELVSQIHSIRKRVLGSGKVAFDAERTSRGGHADRFWAIALACQKERGPEQRGFAEIGVRVIG